MYRALTPFTPFTVSGLYGAVEFANLSIIVTNKIWLLLASESDMGNFNFSRFTYTP